MSARSYRRSTTQRTVDDCKLFDVDVHARVLVELPLRAHEREPRSHRAAGACSTNVAPEFAKTNLQKGCKIIDAFCEAVGADYYPVSWGGRAAKRD